VKHSLVLSIVVGTQSQRRGEGCGEGPEMPTELLQLSATLTNAYMCHWYSDSVLSTLLNTENRRWSPRRSIAGCRD
jgi:hypothetical protein